MDSSGWMFPANYQEWQNQSYQQGSPNIEPEGDLNSEELSSGTYNLKTILSLLLKKY